MKTYMIAAIFTGLSVSTALAAIPAGSNPTSVSVPDLPGGFVIGITGYYLQPSSSNGGLDLVGSHIVSSSGAPVSSHLIKIEPGYSWAWGANIGYVFANTGNDINLTYFDFNTDRETTSTANSPPNDIEPVNLNPGQLQQIFSRISAESDYQISQVDLTLGQLINVGCRLHLHPKAGLQYAHLEDNQNALLSGFFTRSFTEGTLSLNTQAVTSDKSDYSGIGPMVGMDASYYLGMGIGVVTHVDGALLVGSIKNTDNLSAISDTTVTPTQGPVQNFVTNGNFNFSADSTRRIVPTMNTRLGADYSYLFNNANNTYLTIEAGYQVSEYYHAVDRLIKRVDTLELPANIIRHVSSNLNLNGPYASLTLHI